jgi:hypothetical protein
VEAVGAEVEGGEHAGNPGMRYRAAILAQEVVMQMAGLGSRMARLAESRDSRREPACHCH